MNARRSNRFLMWALALSLAAHATLLFFVQNMHYSEAAPAPTPLPPMTVAQFRPPTPPPPTPTPPPEVAPPKASQPSRSLRVAPLVLPPDPNDARPAAPPGPPISVEPPGPDVGPGTDEPAPTVAPPACSDPNAVAQAINPMVPEMPEAAQDEGLSGTTLVKVSLDAAGGVVGVSVYQSSGSMLLDVAAERAARSTNYRPEMANCEPVAGSYIFAADFSQQ